MTAPFDPTTSPPECGAIAPVVLVGGRSRRFGRDKLLEPWGEESRPLVSRPIAALRRAFGTQVVLVGDCDPRVAPLADRHLPDAYPDAGPMGGIATALRALERDVLVAAGDMPGLTPNAIESLLAAARSNANAIAIVAECNGRPHPCFAIYRWCAAPSLHASLDDGRRSLREWLRLTTEPPVGEHRTRRVITVPIDAGSLVNINRPSDAATTCPVPCSSTRDRSRSAE
ncbi:MAG: molybdenum cofactor guanylyltransferase [Phycisphaerales bacterium]